MSLSDIPNELVFLVAKKLSLKSLSSFLSTNYRYFELLTPTLIKIGAHTRLEKVRGNFTVLHWACRNGRKELATALLEAGSDSHAVDNSGKTTLHHAAPKGHTDIMQILIENGVGIDKTWNKSGEKLTAPHLAAAEGREEAVNLLLENGADIEGAGYGVSPLHQAVEGAHEAVVKILLEKGADFNAVYDVDNGNGYGDTILHYAAKMKNKDLFTLVLEKGADWTKKNYNKDTVLHRVAEYGHMKGTRALMEKGASISARNYDRRPQPNSQKENLMAKLSI